MLKMLCAGRARTRTLGSGILRTTYDYYPWTQQGGRLKQILTDKITIPTANRQNLNYGYDAVGNITSIDDNYAWEQLSYTYDALNRLTDATVNMGMYIIDEEITSYNATTGNLATKRGVTLSYGDTAHEHAVTSTTDNRQFGYDANGNMTSRTINGASYTLTYDAENRLTTISGGGITANYTYNGDGNRVKASLTQNSITATTVYIGNYYEMTGGGNTRYYYAGDVRVAFQRSGYSSGNGVFFLLTDHLPLQGASQGSTTMTTDVAGAVFSSVKYTAWGVRRDPSLDSYDTTPTTYKYTGQRWEELKTEPGTEMEDGLYYYNARFYDPALGRFASPDTIVPLANQGMQAWDRYAGMNNNPVKYNDPSGQDGIVPIVIMGIIGGLVIGGYVAADILTVDPIRINQTPAPTGSDLTQWLTDRINENSQATVTQALRENLNSNDLSKKSGAIKAWIALVRAGGEWDYKVDLKNAGISGNISLCGENDISSQAIANIYFGAMGRAVGFSADMLHGGAGVFQLWDNLIKNHDPGSIGPIGKFFDDPFDYWMIDFGIWLFDTHGKEFGKLTKEDLTNAYKVYKKMHGPAGKPLQSN